MIYLNRDLHRRLQKAIGPFLALAIFGYFTYHSIQGSRGILAWFHLNQRLSEAQQLLSSLTEQRSSLEEKVAALRPESINRDLLDQQVRLLLGYSSPDEVIILLNDEGQSQAN